jgi:hypothetical protein
MIVKRNEVRSPGADVLGAKMRCRTTASQGQSGIHELDATTSGR